MIVHERILTAFVKLNKSALTIKAIQFYYSQTTIVENFENLKSHFINIRDIHT